MEGKFARHITGFGIPNLLSVMRMILIPVFVVFFFSKRSYAGPVAAAVLVFSGLTDVADGIIARKFHMITALGQILDPLADKLTQATVCVCLVLKNTAPVWLLLLFVLKEALMVVGGASLIKKGREISSSKWFGKLATVIFYIVVISIIFFNLSRGVTDILLVIALGFMFFSLCMYIPVFRRLISGRDVKQGR